MSQVRKIIKHRSPMQTKKSHPLGQRIMPEKTTLSVYPRVGISLSPSEIDDSFYFCFISIFVHDLDVCCFDPLMMEDY